MKDDGFADSAMRALSFSGSLIGSLNLSVGILQMLVWKGLIAKDEGLFIIDVAAESAAKMPMPEPYDAGLADAYAAARASIEGNS
jgi:hypothetical protein